MIESWVLIILIHSGAFAKYNAIGVTNIPGFATEQECIEAGQDSMKIVKGSGMIESFTCVKQIF
jgi:hypothetical protein